MNPRPSKVQAMENYNLLVTFENGEQKIFDVAPLLERPMYARLKNKGFFSLVKADGTCVYWNDDIDLCPDMTYEKSVSVEVNAPQNVHTGGEAK